MALHGTVIPIQPPLYQTKPAVLPSIFATEAKSVQSPVPQDPYAKVMHSLVAVLLGHSVTKVAKTPVPLAATVLSVHSN